MSQKVTADTLAKPVKRKRNISGTLYKKRKIGSGRTATLVVNGVKSKGKQRAFERPTIPIPEVPNDHERDVSDEDIQFLRENAAAIKFLDKLDHNGIARSKKETRLLHDLSKPPRLATKADDLPSVDSFDEDRSSWSDALSNVGSIQEEDGWDKFSGHLVRRDSDLDIEEYYEREPRGRQGSWSSDKAGIIARLPIKLANGKIVNTGNHTIPKSDTGSEDAVDLAIQKRFREPKFEDVTSGARFGRPAVADVVRIQSRATRIRMAKEQIAVICQDILADPENSLGLLRRLHTFSLPEIATSNLPAPDPNDPLIRRLAMVSQLVVFKDIIPGYRIRPLTDAEKAEKVSQMVGKTREWEQGLVGVYQAYLRALESELKGKTEFSELALSAMCTLLSEATHFNFRSNLMGAVVARLSRKSWDSSSELCLKTLISVFREDVTGLPSLDIVRLLNRMVKEKKFNVHPNSLSCLLHLRLRSELGGIRASETKVNKEGITVGKWESRGKAERKRAKGKKAGGPHLSKKALKVLKEKKGIEGQLREAEAEVDQEERANMHTETLKLLFVLYFRILKVPHWTPLLHPALQGISRYAHLINIDFFKDLLQVLKDIVARTMEDGTAVSPINDEHRNVLGDELIQSRLLCIATAFELLSGQGDALNIDLSDFVNHLYALILPISLQADIESIPRVGAGPSDSTMQQSTADILFQTLSLVFPTSATGTRYPQRAAAFAKRMAIACLSFSPKTVLRSLTFIQGLILKEPKLQALLSTEDRTADGIYRPELDDSQLSNPFATSFWELAHLAATHWDSSVREMACRLSQFEGM